jgi:hypothetical protein
MRFVESVEEMENNETFKKVSAMCDKYGYSLYTMVNRVWTRYNMPIIQINKKNDNRYAPLISYTSRHFDGNDYHFEIQTTSYGSLDMDEYPKFLKATSDAYELVKELSQISIDEWPAVDCRETE